MPTDPSYLVETPTTPEVLTPHRETDVCGALMRGLAQYLGRARADVKGRALRFRSVEEEWSEGADIGDYPALAVHAPEDGQYGDSATAFTPMFVGAAPDRQLIYTPCTFNVSLSVEVWCTLPPERRAMLAALEDMLFPVEWMSGVRIALPHYHGVHARYTLTSGARYDDEDKAQQRCRRATLRVEAQAPLVRLRPSKPNADIRAVIALTDEG